MDSIPNPTPSPIPLLKLININNSHGLTLTKKDSVGFVYSVPFSSLDASSCCYRINSFVVCHSTDSGYILKKTLNDSLLSYDETIPKDVTIESFLTLNSIKEYDMIYLVLQGNYKDATTKKTYPIKDVYFNNPKSNTSGEVKGKTKKEVMKMTKK